MAASKAAQRRAALSATVSRTGWMSVGELLMTRRTSPVAVLLLEGFDEVPIPGFELLE